MHFDQFFLHLKTFFFLMLRHWPIVILSGILLALILSNVNFGFTIAGWDNFSVSFDLFLNFPRTFFSTWREYRGLGVVSDSEVVDIFRQVILIILNIFFPTSVIDALYYLGVLSLGVFSMYFLGREVSRSIFHTPSRFLNQLTGYVASLLYLFSFHTVGTFHLPIAMYVIRYGFFPLQLFLVVRILNQKKDSSSLFLALAVSLLFGSAAYLTATVFITFLIIFTLLFMSYFFRFSRFIKVGLLILAMNMFWMLPFINYTIQKSSLLPQASTFIDVNEIQLNQSPDQLAFNKIFSFTPSFFYTKYVRMSDGATLSLPDVSIFNSQTVLFTVGQVLIFIFFLIGIGILLKQLVLKKISGVWILLLSLSSIFFLRKEYPPFGFFYDFLGNTIPLLKILLRFGGEKFYQLFIIAIALTTSIALAKSIEYIVHLKKSERKNIFAVCLILSFTFLVSAPFAGFFSGNLFSSLVQVKVPEQYREISSQLNKTQKFGRVLHLPFDENSYWKSYSWGYVGSSFLNFLIERPLLDRTFEPASIENDVFNQAVTRLLKNSAHVDDQELESRAKQFIRLMEITQVSEIIVDETVQPEVLSRDGKYFGNYSVRDTQAVVKKMVELGELEKTYESEVDLEKFAQLYGEKINSGQHTVKPKISLYENKKTFAAFSSFGSATNADPHLNNLFLKPILLSPTIHTLQSSLFPQRTYPFLNKQGKLTQNKSTFSLEFPFKYNNEFSIQLPSSQQESQRIFSVDSRTEANEVIVQLKEVQPPSFVNSEVEKVVLIYESRFSLPEKKNTFQAADNKTVSNSTFGAANNFQFGLTINDSYVPLREESDSSIAQTVLIQGDKIQVSLIEQLPKYEVEGTRLVSTNNPNCFQDKGENYQQKLLYGTDGVTMLTSDGSNCVTFSLVDEKIEADYFGIQLGFVIDEERQELKTEFPTRWQEQVAESIKKLPKYNYLKVCLINKNTQECLNNHQVISANMSNTMIFPDQFIASSSSQVLLSLTAPAEATFSATIQSVNILPFKLYESKEITLAENNSFAYTVNTNPSESLTLTVPKVLSPYAFLSHPEFTELQSFQGKCVNETGEKETRLVGSTLVSLMYNCQQGLYQQLPFSSKLFQLWTVNYHVFAGKNPQFSLQSNNNYVQEYISRFRDFPNITGFKDLQKADPLFVTTESINKTIDESLLHANYRSAYTYVSPQHTTDESSSLVYAVTQNAENQAAMGVSDMTVVALPAQWENLSIDNGDPELSFRSLEIIQTQRILPSLWKVKVKVPSAGSGVLAPLVLHQAFDQQWKVYQSSRILDAFFGRNEMNVEHTRVDGWANGWLLPVSQLPKDQEIEFIVFFTPERLAVIGWLITFGTFGGIVFAVGRKKVLAYVRRKPLIHTSK